MIWRSVSCPTYKAGRALIEASSEVFKTWNPSDEPIWTRKDFKIALDSTGFLKPRIVRFCTEDSRHVPQIV